MKQKLLSCLKFLIKDGLLVCGAVVLGVLGMTFVYTFSTNVIENNVAQSASTLEKEDLYLLISSSYSTYLDNYTDSLMMLEASHPVTSGALKSSLKNEFYLTEGTTSPYASLVAHYIDGEEFASDNTYSRYWHGYLIFLKPLLSMLSYQNIRVINFIAQSTLTIVVVYLLFKRGLRVYAIPFIISVILLSPAITSMSLQFSACYYVFLLSFISILMLKDINTKYLFALFCIFGILTSFFDFLTYPMLTLGMPLALVLAIKNYRRIFDSVHDIVSLSISWFIGYIGMWSGKWIVSSLLLRQNIVKDAIKNIFIRSSSESFSRLGAINTNYAAFFNNPLIILFFVFMLVTLCLIIKNKKYDNGMVKIIGFIVVACIPIVWYFVVSNHSSIHSFFTNRLVSVTTFSLMCMSLKLLTCQKPGKSVLPSRKRGKTGSN